MIDVLKNKMATYPTLEEKYAQLREYLQELVLKSIEKHGSMQELAFVGGTALRILYDLPRFSEDLDFSQIKPGKFDFQKLLDFIQRDLKLYGFSVSLTKKEIGTVKNSFIKFEQLLHPMGLSPHQNQVLSIKLEIDTDPPNGYQTQVTMINKSFLMQIQHFDQPSLFSGKCHALLCRPYSKGRDFFDLLWFIGKKITPNYLFLSNAYEQTEHKKITVDTPKLKSLLIKKIQELDFKKIISDVEPFLMNKADRSYFTPETFLSAIESWDIA